MRMLDPVLPGNSRLGTVYWREACSSWFVLCTWPLVSGWNLSSQYGAELFPHLRSKLRATVWHDAAGAHHQSLAISSADGTLVIKWACLEKWSTVVRIIMLPAKGGRPVMKSRDMWVQCCCPGRLGPLAPSRKRSEESCGHGTGSLTLDTHLTSRHRLPVILFEGRPPKQTLQENYHAVQVWIAREPGRMPPMDDLGSNWGWVVTWIREPGTRSPTSETQQYRRRWYSGDTAEASKCKNWWKRGLTFQELGLWVKTQLNHAKKRAYVGIQMFGHFEINKVF